VLMTNSDYQISGLVEKAKFGNRASIAQLVDLFYKDIYRMVYYRTHSRMDAEDLTQEIFMQMVKSIPRLKDTTCFRVWLFRIALNRVRDFCRKKRWAFLDTTTEIANVDKEIADNHSNPENLMIKKEFWKQFNQFTESLTRWEREVFILRFVGHLGIREIAEILNKNDSTVKTHLYRALKKFKQSHKFHNLIKGEI
jgi:RNA polymerase sigma-70 factor (ECF subfamily)